MKLLYNLIVDVYHLSIKLASPFNSKAKLWINGRKKIWQRIEKEVNPNEKLVWFHAASLGEFEQGRPVIEAFRDKYSNYKILLTFFSPSGFEIRKNYKGVDHVFYLPPDSQKNVAKFLRMVNPQLAVFIKYEFWFNYLNQLRNSNVPVLVISANFRKEQHFFKPIGKWAARQLGKIDHFFVQNDKSEKLLHTIGIEQVTVSGDTRFDRVANIAAKQKENRIAAAFSKGKKVILAGSSWPQDEKLLRDAVDLNNENIRLIIAPHETHEEHLKSIETLFKDFNVVRYSKATSESISKAKVLLIDGMGFLSGLYRYCDVACIGGGFGKGIHNILEAVTFGKPVVFGPNYTKFEEAVQLLKLGGAFSIQTKVELKLILQKLFSDQMYYQSSSMACSEYIHKNTGATEKILGHFSQLL